MAPALLHAQMDVEWEGSVTMNAGSGELAPYYIASNRGGTLTQQYSTLLSGTLTHATDTVRKSSFGFGAELWGGYASSAGYDRYDAESGQWGLRNVAPARFWVQQLYAEAKYRSILLTVGQKRHVPQIVNDRLGSGDMAWSGNARPEPGVNVGFVNFQTVPFTHGWVQVAGQLGYYFSTGGKWLKSHFGYYNASLTTSQLFHYKNIYLRTHPDRRLVFTIGMQDGCQFGGNIAEYEHGKRISYNKMKCGVGDFFKVLLPGGGGNNEGDKYYEGNHVGSWDVSLDYKLAPGMVLRGYYQSPWEDGSGIGKLNGFDGLWGLEWRNANGMAPVSGVVVEYIDLTNQSGPIHYRPSDYSEPGYEGGLLTRGQATGSDDYYNNYAYCGYQSRGMSIGSPFVKSPLYNTDGYMGFTDNLVRGFHIGVSGHIGSEVDYRALGSYRRSWGTPFVPRIQPASATSLMIEAGYSPRRVAGLKLTAQLALDRGRLYGNNAGALLCISYSGIIRHNSNHSHR